MKIVIMAGGRGTRFWPRSVEDRPKQFLPFHSEQTLIQEAVGRFRAIVPESRLYIAAPRRYLPLLEEQLPDFPHNRLIVEPQQKDTAACIALAAFGFLQSGDNEPVVFVPSDQYVADTDVFLRAVEAAAEIALQPDAIVTLGIEPTRPETGFGYMVTAAAEVDGAGLAGYDPLRVVRFVEKPPLETALELLDDPGVYWNSGIIACRPNTIARCIEACEPTIWSRLEQHPHDADAAYEAMPRLSIDYAVMERAKTIYCLPVRCGWDDIGSWAALRRHLEPDGSGNVSRGDVKLTDASGNIVFVDDKQAIIVGVSDLIVVSTSEGLLVCPRSEEQRLKLWLSG